MKAPLLAFLATLPFGPQDDAPPERGLTVRTEKALDGYTLLSPLMSRSTFLVDMDGEVVHRWDAELGPGNMAYLLPNGNLLRLGRHLDNPVFWGGGIGGRFQEFTRDGELVWDWLLSDEYQCHHHDAKVLPNGNLLVIVWEFMSRDDAILFGRDPEATSPEGLWPDAILEIEPVRPDDARVVWEWHALDHLIQDFDPEKPNYGSVADNPGRIDINADHRDLPALTDADRERQEKLEEEMRALGYVGGKAETEGPPPTDRGGRAVRADWLHTNSVDWHPELDLLVLSTPRMNEIWVIDHSTTTEEAAGATGGRWGRGGELLWRWGNPRNYGAGTDEDRRLFAQHDATWVDGPDGEPRILVFNNGGGRPQGDFSSVDELVLPLDGEGRIAPPGERGYGPLKLSWTYRAPEREDFYSSFISGAQRLPNGNTLICEGATGRVFEVTRDREIVWELLSPLTGDVEGHFGKAAGGRSGAVPPHSLFRATRIAADDPALAPLGR